MNDDLLDYENMPYDENDIEDFEDYITYYHLENEDDDDEEQINELYF